MPISGNKKTISALSHVKGIFFDLDDTLYEYAPCNAMGQAAAFAYLSKTLAIRRKKIAQAFERSRAEVKRRIPDQGASHSRTLYFQNVLERLSGKTDTAAALCAEEIFWKAYFKKMKLRPGVREFLKTAKEKHMKVGIVSDLTAQIQMKKLVRLGIAGYVDILVTSEESGKEKPAPDSFKLALKKSGLTPREVIMIGEDPARDVRGAKRLGMQTVWFTGHSSFRDIEKFLFGK